MGEVERREGGAPSMACIEVFKRSGKVDFRVPVTDEPLTLGRAYDSGVILDDPYVSPRHVKVRREGDNLLVEDLESVNGLYVGEGKVRTARASIPSGERFRIGRTAIRFCGPGLEVPPAVPDRLSSTPFRFLTHPLSLVMTGLGTLLLLLINLYLDSPGRLEGHALVSMLTGIVLVVVLWSAFWSFAGRLMTHRWNFHIHCAIAAAGLTSFTLAEMLLSTLLFLMALDGWQKGVENAAYLLLLTAWVYAHLTLVSPASTLRLLRGAAIVSFLIVATVVVIDALEERQFSSQPRYAVLLKPPFFRGAGGRDAAAFFAGTGALRDEIVREVEAAREAGGR